MPGLLLSLALPILAATTPGVVLADDGGFVHAAVDHVVPGQPFPIVLDELDTGSVASIRMSLGRSVADLGRVTVGTGGSASMEATLPADFPLGYATLEATTDTGQVVSTFVRVAHEGFRDSPRDALDERLIALVGFVMGLLVFVAAGAWYLRARPRQSD